MSIYNLLTKFDTYYFFETLKNCTIVFMLYVLTTYLIDAFGDDRGDEDERRVDPRIQSEVV